MGFISDIVSNVKSFKNVILPAAISYAINNRAKSVAQNLDSSLTSSISSGEAVSPSSAAAVTSPQESESPYTEFSNSDDYFDNYLSMLQKAQKVGIIASAQDAANQAAIDRSFQSLEAQKERDWYEKLSNTAYQRQIQDLEAAGLNPILGWANLGSGASSAHAAVPSGTSSPIRTEAPNLADFLNAAANLVSSGAKVAQSISSFLPKVISKI